MEEQTSTIRLLLSPVLTLLYPWLNVPDTKFSAPGSKGIWHTDAIGRGAEAEALVAKIDAAVDEAFDAYCEEKALTPAQRKKWTKAYPYERLEDDQGNPTGEIKFAFKQNAEIVIRKTGERKEIPMPLYDSQGKEMHSPVYNGSRGRMRFSMRMAPQQTAQKVGIRLDLAAVQIVELKTSRIKAEEPTFEPIEGGYVELGDDARYLIETEPSVERLLTFISERPRSPHVALAGRRVAVLRQAMPPATGAGTFESE